MTKFDNNNLKVKNKRISSLKSFAFRYGLALVAGVITIVVAYLFKEYEIKLNIAILIVTALILPTWFGGRGPGLLLSFVFTAISILAKPIPPPETELIPYLFGHFSTLTVYLMVVLLVSSRRNVEKSLRESEKRYRRLFENNPMPMWVHDLESHNFLAVNAEARVSFGYSSDEFLSMTVQKLLTSDWNPILTDDSRLSSVVVSKGQRSKLRKKDGSILDVEITFHEDHFDGRLSRIVSAIDVTERLKQEDAVRSLNETLEQRVQDRTEELESANNELEAFSYSVSHDLRTPLRAIDGFTRIFAEDYGDKLDDEGRRILGVIRKGAQNMGQLIDDLLAFSRLGRKPIEASQIDMNGLANTVKAEVGPESNTRPIHFSINRMPNALGDATLIKQVLVNLFSNAVKYSGTKDSIDIEIGATTNNTENIYYVRDHGVGFDMKYSNKLFGVFQRLHSPEEFEGTGVGLAIVQRIVHRHGGRVWAESEVNNGATFYFSLPRTETHQEAIS